MRNRVLGVLAALAAVACGEGSVVAPEHMTKVPDAGVLAIGEDQATGATIETDKDDYAPGEVVHLTGRGWAPGETVHLDMTESPDTHGDVQQDVVADSTGAFSLHFYDVQVHDLGVTFTLTATGGTSRSVAVVVFTDANSAITGSVTPASVTTGGSLTWSASATCTGPSSGANSCANSGSALYGAVPNGYTINLLRAPGACNAPGTFVQVASASTTGGTTGSLSITAPAVAGFYAYRFDHPSQDINSKNWAAVGQGTTPCTTVEVTAPANIPPTANAGGPYTGNEGNAINLTGSGSDPDGGTVSYLWSSDAPVGTCVFGDATQASTTVTCGDNGSWTLTLRVTDDEGSSTDATASLSVANVAPTITGLTLPAAPVAVNTNTSIQIDFTDPAGANDTYTALVNWDDGLGYDTSVSSFTSGGSITRTFSTPGIYTICVKVADEDGGTSTEVCSTDYIVVYDPSAGFVTGGGWINSPLGAYAADASLTGKASFDFVSKYQKEATTPTGSTEFQFHAGALNFKSTSYQWLVVSGAQAQYKGDGTVNGVAGYGFILSAWDGQQTGGDGVDKFRIKITDAGGNVVYDNQMGGAVDAVPNTALGGGSIVIHTGGKSK